jgi:hypothetical protein
MNFRKNSTLIVGGGVALLLLIAALVFLFMSRGSYLENRDAYESTRRKLDQLNNRNPFPSTENVDLLKENLALLTNNYAGLRGKIEAAQIPVEAIEPARFAPMLEAAISDVLERAAAAEVTMPSVAGLGFKDYAEGKLPPNDPKVLARLVVQVRTLQDVIGAALDAGVSSVDLLQRDDFELRAAPEPEPESRSTRRSRGRRDADPVRPKVDAHSYVPGVPMPPVNAEFQVERFVVGITGREFSLWTMVNHLMRSDIMYSIADITLENSAREDLGRPVDMNARLTAIQNAARTAAQMRQTPMGGMGAPGGGAAQAELTWSDISKEQRYAGGRDLIKATLVVDMFRFSDQDDGVEEARR